jgi:hypothetical protein
MSHLIFQPGKLDNNLQFCWINMYSVDYADRRYPVSCASNKKLLNRRDSLPTVQSEILIAPRCCYMSPAGNRSNVIRISMLFKSFRSKDHIKKVKSISCVLIPNKTRVVNWSSGKAISLHLKVTRLQSHMSMQGVVIKFLEWLHLREIKGSHATWS